MPDKLTEVYQFRISSTLLHNVKSKLTKQELDVMLEDMRDLMSKHVHLSKAIFNPKMYQDENEVN